MPTDRLMGGPLATVSRRDAILEAARIEFAENGYSGARIERIAATAKANKQLIFHYFDSKDGLYSTAIASVFGNPPSPPESSTNPPDALRRYVAGLAAWFATTPGAARAASECAPGRPVPSGAARAVNAWMERVSGGIRSVIDDGQRKGYFRDDIATQVIVGFVVGSAVGHALVGQMAISGAAPATSFPTLLSQLAVDLCAWR